MKDKEIENSIDGYKYLVSMTTILNEREFPQDNICICDTRDCAIKVIQDMLNKNIEVNKKEGTIAEPFKINRLGCLVKWRDKENNKWMWEFGIFPVKYVNE